MEKNLGRIVIIGFGNMGKSLARGLQRSTTAELFAFDRQPLSESEVFPVGLDISKITVLCEDDIPQISKRLLLNENDTLILCTKPQNLIDAGEKWRNIVLGTEASRPLVISILAGTTTELVHKYFAVDAPVVRAMPNIAATVDEAATAICASKSTPLHFLKRAQSIFDCVGKTWIVNEDQLNTVTGLSGSGPAYIYMVIEALSDGGVKMGMPRHLALELAAQTVLGAAKLVQESKLHPAVLRDQVTTPGGTTITAIHELEKHGLRTMLISAVVTATKRSALLAKIVEKAILKK